MVQPGPRPWRRRRGGRGRGSGAPPGLGTRDAAALEAGQHLPPRGTQPEVRSLATDQVEERAGYVLALTDGRLVFRPAERPAQALRSAGQDVPISPAAALTYGLRPGDYARVQVSAGRGRPQLAGALEVSGWRPDVAAQRPRFDNMTAIHPDRQLVLERPGSVTARVVDLFAPLGFGSRVLVVSPPKAGKTTILREIALSVIANHPEVRVICCLIGERPEEATDFTRLLPKETSAGTPVEVVATTFDDAMGVHATLADLTAERARRLVESGKDVVLIVDSITRLVRAHNLAIRGRDAGRTLSGGVSAGAIAPSRRFFGAARATEEGPSLTVIASCLVMTGSRQDDLVYEELKGTGNSEIALDRRLAERRVFPAINVPGTGTRREELLLTPERLEAVKRVRRVFATAENPTLALTRLIERVEATRDNETFLRNLPGGR